MDCKCNVYSHPPSFSRSSNCHAMSLDDFKRRLEQYSETLKPESTPYDAMVALENLLKSLYEILTYFNPYQV